MLFRREQVSQWLRRLAEEHDIYVGSSSWKYADWCGLLYDEERYFHNGRFSQARFERECLTEYAGVFPSVGVDATYYRIPKVDYLQGLASQVTPGFRFTFKVPDDLTIKNYPQSSHFGSLAGQTNTDFLDPAIFRYAFLRNLEAIREHVGLLIFEFSHFGPEDFPRGRDFVEALDRFFGELPKDWHYGVEVRNRNLLHPDYFAMLKRHGVAHIYSQWTQMPPVSEQLALLPPADNAFVAARYLLSPGHTHASAAERMAPYSRIYEIDREARLSLVSLLEHLMRRDPKQRKPAWIYVGNQLEGSALHTLADVLETVFSPASLTLSSDASE